MSLNGGDPISELSSLMLKVSENFGYLKRDCWVSLRCVVNNW